MKKPNSVKRQSLENELGRTRFAYGRDTRSLKLFAQKLLQRILWPNVYVRTNPEMRKNTLVEACWINLLSIDEVGFVIDPQDFSKYVKESIFDLERYGDMRSKGSKIQFNLFVSPWLKQCWDHSLMEHLKFNQQMAQWLAWRAGVNNQNLAEYYIIACATKEAIDQQYLTTLIGQDRPLGILSKTKSLRGPRLVHP